jgi:hypothetical protein
MDFPLFVGLSLSLVVRYISIILTKSSQSRESYEYIYFLTSISRALFLSGSNGYKETE